MLIILAFGKDGNCLGGPPLNAPDATRLGTKFLTTVCGVRTVHQQDNRDSVFLYGEGFCFDNTGSDLATLSEALGQDAIAMAQVGMHSRHVSVHGPRHHLYNPSWNELGLPDDIAYFEEG